MPVIILEVLTPLLQETVFKSTIAWLRRLRHCSKGLSAPRGPLNKRAIGFLVTTGALPWSKVEIAARGTTAFRIDCASRLLRSRFGSRQRQWDRADGQKQKQVKCASDKMRFDGGINLLFHIGIVLIEF